MSTACIQLGFEKICMIQSLSTVYGYIEALKNKDRREAEITQHAIVAIFASK